MTDGAPVAARSRAVELAANLEALRTRVAAACRDAGRDPDGIALIAVTKTYPASDIRLLAGLGITDIGENRDQEAAGKAAELAGEVPITWHFVGQLQTNKARSVARYAGVVHTVDRERLIGALSAGAVRAGRTLRCLVQVRLDPRPWDDPARGGAAPEEVPELADGVAGARALELGGVMAVAPRGGDPGPAFARLAEVAERLRIDHPEATVISAGMSGDLEQAICHGATHLRVGTALLGVRRPFVR